MKLVGDFETTTNQNDCRVWAWGVADLETTQILDCGNSIDTFMRWVEIMTIENPLEIYFHNLKFDVEFILPWLLNNGFTHSRKGEPMTFDTVVDHMGTWYKLEITWGTRKRKKKKGDKDYFAKTTIKDSLKKIPLRVSQIPKAYGIENQVKGEIDYTAHRPIGHKITNEEFEYLKNDVEIVAKALQIQRGEGLTSLTIGSDALKMYKKVIGGEERFRKYFPLLRTDIDGDCRKAYKGGYTYMNPKYQGKRVEGITYDVNSLYPSVMMFEPLPYSYPKLFEGEYQYDKNYPLFIAHIRCSFEVKEDYIPCIQVKSNPRYQDTEYLSSSCGELDMWVTSVDLDLYQRQYNFTIYEWYGGYSFRSSNVLFQSYIKHWNDVKVQATIEGNEGLRSIAKLLNNSLYGKFATNPVCQNKVPVMVDGIVKYTKEEGEDKELVYTPVGAFITAYARYKTITSAQKNYHRFIYADTDSIHLEGYEIPSNIDIHNENLGAWKCEGFFDDSIFLRAKTYMEHYIKNGKGLDITPHWDVKCSGMPDNVKKMVTPDNFKSGSVFDGKLTPCRVVGGVVLLPTTFTIN